MNNYFLEYLLIINNLIYSFNYEWNKGFKINFILFTSDGENDMSNKLSNYKKWNITRLFAILLLEDGIKIKHTELRFVLFSDM